MVRLYAVLSVLTLVLWVYCLFDVITTDESRCRNAPKMLWVIVVLLAPLLGSLLWLIAGRPQTFERDLPYKGNTGSTGSAYPEYERPGRFVATNPDDDEEFLRRCRERAEEQRRKAAEQRRRVEGHRDEEGDPPLR